MLLSCIMAVALVCLGLLIGVPLALNQFVGRAHTQTAMPRIEARRF
jgi:hypothetical protein